MSDRAKKLQDPGPHRHGVERERAASAAVAHSLAEIGGVPHAPCRNETPPDQKLNSLASFKSAMVDQLDSVYGLALAVTQSPAKAEELSFLSFAQALDEIKAQGVVSSAPRQLLFRSLYGALCRQTPAMKIDFSLPVNPMEMPAAARNAGYGELDWASLGEGLKAAMKSLPIGLRFIFHLWAVEESPINEIAELLGVPSVEIWVRLTEARAGLCRFASEAPENPHSM